MGCILVLGYSSMKDLKAEHSSTEGPVADSTSSIHMFHRYCFL